MYEHRHETDTDLKSTPVAAFHRFKDAGLPNWAAALTYYGVLALFPAVIAIVSLLGVIGESATGPVLENVATLTPGPGQDILTSAIQGVQSNSGASTFVFIFGLLVAFWSSSGYVSAFMDAANAAYGVDEDRSLLKKLPMRLLVTGLIFLAVIVCAAAIVLTGTFAQHAGEILGVGDSAVQAWDIAKIPVILAIVCVIFGLLFWGPPNVTHESLKLLVPGCVAALVIWLIASALFGIYVAGFASYNQTYGALGGAIAFLVWLWISNMAILFGAALNAEVEYRHKTVETDAEETTLEEKLAAH